MSNLQMIPVLHLWHHPKNPRKQIGDVSELAQSIRESGILQNLTVVQRRSEITDELLDAYYVVIGNRRLEAAKLAGLKEVPCAVVEMTEAEQFKTMMVENMQRSDLTVLEEADGFQLMLDMGSTVAEISQQTGISETKIRNRVKLTKLDRKAAAEGFKRGARLEDYLKLEKLTDEGRRNAVLQKIGTKDFNERLQAAVKEEKDIAWIEGERNRILAEGWAKETQDHPGEGWEFVMNRGYWNHKEFEKPADAGEVPYLFRVCGREGCREIDLYRKGGKSKTEQDKATEIHTRMNADLDVIWGELRDESKRFQALRQQFVTETFGRYERYQEEIMKISARAFLRQRYGYAGTGAKDACDALGLKWEKGMDQANPDQMKQLTREQPAKALLFAAYFRMETEATDPFTRMWDGDISANYPIYNNSQGLKRLYAALAEIGYVTSTEEDMFMNGGCMQFQEAKAVVAKAREELGI